jgi:hypothetical protein
MIRLRPLPVRLLAECFCGTEQVNGGGVQRTSEDVDVEQAYVPLPSLEAAYIGAVQPATVGQLLLRQLRLLTERT